jgi:hypothetical protein
MLDQIKKWKCEIAQTGFGKEGNGRSVFIKEILLPVLRSTTFKEMPAHSGCLGLRLVTLTRETCRLITQWITRNRNAF